MAYLINEECVNCGACIAACPVDAITEGESIHVIDADICIECGASASDYAELNLHSLKNFLLFILHILRTGKVNKFCLLWYPAKFNSLNRTISLLSYNNLSYIFLL